MNLEKCWFEVKNEEHSKAIQRRLYELGYEWNGYKSTTFKYLDKDVIIITGKNICFGNEHVGWFEKRNDYTKITLDDLYDVPEPIYIDKVKVHFTDNGIEIDQIKVSKETVQKIWERLNK